MTDDAVFSHPDFLALLAACESVTPDWGRVGILADWLADHDARNLEVVFRLAMKHKAWPAQNISWRGELRWWWAEYELPRFILTHEQAGSFGTFNDMWRQFLESYRELLAEIAP